VENSITELLEGWGKLHDRLSELEDEMRAVKDAMRTVEMHIAGASAEKDIRDLSHGGVRVRRITSLSGDPYRLMEINPSLVRKSETIAIDRVALREYWNLGEDARKEIEDVVHESTTYKVELDARKGRGVDG